MKHFKEWVNCKYSNLQYLMLLNFLSGRSFKDLTQYPVFPWIFQKYDNKELNLSEQTLYRDLSKSMGALGTEERIKQFIFKYESGIQDIPPYHFGTHYSSPAIIYQYLLRIKPYTDGAWILQNGKFDIADRLFFSMKETYKNATEETSDVRELLPEFFFLPELFLNLDANDFGLQQTKERVHNVSLPPWCGQDPFKFVVWHRKGLENELVSKNINQWIDLIFGYKQKGKEAENNLNKFYYLTYEDAIDIDSIKDENYKIGIESQIINFGQTPSQIFQVQHVQRILNQTKMLLTFTELSTSLQFFRSVCKNQKSNEGQNLQLKDFYFNSLKDRTIVSKSLNKNKNIYFYIKHQTYLTFYLTKKQLILTGGLWDGHLNLYNVESEKITQDFKEFHFETVTAMNFENRYQILITGSKNGDVCIIKVSPDYQSFNEIYHYYDHFEEITDINICEDMISFATSSLDGTINLYNYQSYQFLRQYNHPKYYPINKVEISICPLYSIIFFSQRDCTFYSYSINGQFLASFKEDSMIILNPKIIKDSQQMEYFVKIQFIYKNIKKKYIFIFFQKIGICQLQQTTYINFRIALPQKYSQIRKTQILSKYDLLVQFFRQQICYLWQ
ncbi:hypothetical protein IMG5_128290 [Ichthyophthirius multifiliis]|uniref:BEACH domain-containing protein n=1 Tax=Ichthyophthirius multifiliis TaxID=5932 RepID=G0QW04_ICHMU|nr:hypothetical protein IMG5_128290 [Ichthyophthirius multifiliis]EGR30597.1 hypothetical protein IMG5_128290 [Ichthyophthirius multifiliis]|eukprot:XP_004032184.1 hypothetical protein IMG5_128290 [Ichthyophthirius multifiliis]